MAGASLRTSFDMDIRAPDQRYNPYRIFSREQWAALRNDTPMTLEPGEFSQLNRLMSNIRQALCLLRSGPTEATKIRTVELVLSLWSGWKTVSDFRSTEIIR